MWYEKQGAVSWNEIAHGRYVFLIFFIKFIRVGMGKGAATEGRRERETTERHVSGHTHAYDRVRRSSSSSETRERERERRFFVFGCGRGSQTKKTQREGKRRRKNIKQASERKTGKPQRR